MKNTLLGLAILLTLDASAQKISDQDPISSKVLQSFQQEFAKATNISWMPDKNKNIYHARFLYNNEPVEAFFTDDGTLISTARFISERQLPIMVIKELLNNYSFYSVTQVVEFTNDHETSYMINAYNEKETLLLKFFANGDSQRVKRIRNKS
ncbi:MAG TPA: hypothetical protein VK543_13430 [Puia sp.]|nr:hypothetical protein [Puia sp.]